MIKIISKYSNPLMVENKLIQPEVITEVSKEAANLLKRLYPSHIMFVEVIEDVKSEDLDREALKAKAEDLGIEFAKNIKTEALAKLIEDKLS